MEVGGERTWVVMSRSQPLPCCPEKSGIIRVDTFCRAMLYRVMGGLVQKVGGDRDERGKMEGVVW